VPYITKFKRNPVTGKPLAVKDLIKIQFHKNADGEYQCPVLHKVFTEFTHIVAVKKTGNVFSYEAIRELNIKPKNWKELLTDEPFTKDDIITIQVSTVTCSGTAISAFTSNMIYYIVLA
jgi:peptidyl-prolyl cis-trans isomerase-like protein 2